MTKKRTSMLKILLTFALAMILSLSLALPALTADGEIDWDGGTPDSPAQAAITKIFKMPIATPTPNVTFKFEFEKRSYNGENGIADLAKMPPITTAQIAFPVAGNDPAAVDGVRTIVKETENLLGGITWTHPGAYIYRVTETTTDIFTNTFAETITFSKAVYDLHVYVKEGINSAGVKVFYVYLVGALIVVEDEDGGEVGDKVNPQPGGEPGVTGDYSKMVFTNYFLKNNGGEDPDPDDPDPDPEDPKDIEDNTVLQISKTVTGEGGFGEVEKPFEFKVTVTQPATVTGTKIYRAYIMDEDGVVTGPIRFTGGSEKTVQLKHGQWLAFLDMPVGSSFKVIESAAEGYTPSALVKAYGISNKGYTGDKDASLTIPDSTEIAYLDDNKDNSAAFTNKFKDIIFTGISVDNLPYIILIVMAVLALSSFVFVKYQATLKSNA